jgi:putative salt-induced outer membrane protein YdiY
MKKNIVIPALIIVLQFAFLNGDVIKIGDDSVLKGKIIKIEEGKIFFETQYAGKLEIDQQLVSGFETDNPVFVRLGSGNTMAGVVQLNSAGEIEVKNDDGRLITQTSKVKSIWLPGTKDPEVLKVEAEVEANKRKWHYSAGVDIKGKKGNTDQQNVGVNLKANLKSPQDSLKFYFKSAMAERNNRETEDEKLGGVNYSFYYDGRWGWFVRSELEADKFEGVNFRSTNAGGLTYRIINKKEHNLESRAGLAYLFEDHVDNTENKRPSFDLGIDHMYNSKNRWSVNSELSFIPSMETFDDYFIFQDTGIIFPLANSESWKLRIGLADMYNSNPSKSKESLDTTYYTRFILEFQ